MSKGKRAGKAMTADDAIRYLRALDEAARLGWPDGYDAARARREAGAALAALSASVEAVPREYQALLAQGYMREIGR